MEVSEYAALDGLGIAQLVQRGLITPAEALDAALRATAQVNPAINAVTEVFADMRLDQPPPSADRGAEPFSGVPFMVKDLTATERGRRCEAGSRLLRGYVAEHDTELMRRFRQAGLVNIGRTASSEFGITATVETAANGPTRNPWHPERSTAGSSGGAAAAVAAGMIPLAHASDGGGSIRMPAAACGVVGLKPSRGRVPSGRRDVLGDLGVEFAITKTVRDTAALLDAVSGPAPGDPYLIARPAGPYRELIRDAPRRLRIALCTENPWGRAMDPQVVQAAHHVADLLEDMGHVLTEAPLRVPADRYIKATLTIWSAANASLAATIEAATGRVSSPDSVEGLTWARIEYGRSLKASELIEALETHEQTRRQLATYLQNYDAMLAPTLPTLPIPLGQYDPTAPVNADWYYTGPVGNLESITSVFNCTGQPAISLPLCQSENGLPIGIHLATPVGDEATLLQLAAELEAARPWSQRTPSVHVATQQPTRATTR